MLIKYICVSKEVACPDDALWKTRASQQWYQPFLPSVILQRGLGWGLGMREPRNAGVGDPILLSQEERGVVVMSTAVHLGTLQITSDPSPTPTCSE